MESANIMMNRVASVGQVVFAVIIIALGIQGLIKGDFTAVWAPVPESVPARQLLAYVCASIFLASGIGLLWRRVAVIAARVLLASLIIWFLLWRVEPLFTATIVDSTWSCGETMAMIAGAWVLFARFASEGNLLRIDFPAGDKGLRIARVLYGLALIPFGYAHFAYLAHTADMVPRWLPWHLGWAYFTGVAFIAASVAILCNVFARLAAALSALQMALFLLLVWVPTLAAGPINAFQQGEVATNLALMAAGWVVAESYWHTRGSPPAATLER